MAASPFSYGREKFHEWQRHADQLALPLRLQLPTDDRIGGRKDDRHANDKNIREMSHKWLSNAEIHRGTGISQPTTRKHIAMDDFSSQAPRAQGHPSVLDLYKPFVDSILMEDRRAHAHRLRQRHRCGPQEGRQGHRGGAVQADGGALRVRGDLSTPRGSAGSAYIPMRVSLKTY